MMRTYYKDINADFICKHCGYFVSSLTLVSGVVNRNHCPYCLHSQHVDLYHPGDRLCPCKALMAPVGLTLKRSRDKYAPDNHGELMVVHRCINCGELSINRIAADDDPEKLLAILKNSTKGRYALLDECRIKGIRLLDEKSHRYLVQSRLFGRSVDLWVEAAKL
ncbi:MAG TPA: RNHCP domain-containing protein [Brevefilum sp.]